MPLTIATFNVNSVKARLPNLLAWLDVAAPDVVLLQETKCLDDGFPGLELSARAYRIATHGQKTYNGVAILARHEIEDPAPGLPGEPEDAQARYLEATVAGVRVASIYLPNGNPVTRDAAGVPTEKFAYKLRWFERLRRHAEGLFEDGRPVVLGGDYNVIPTDLDVANPAGWGGDALYQPESRAAWRALVHRGWTDALRALHPEPGLYTFWDYQEGAWQRDLGIRIDHFLLNPRAADRLESCVIDRAPRGEPKASDHTPVIVTLRI